MQSPCGAGRGDWCGEDGPYRNDVQTVEPCISTEMEQGKGGISGADTTQIIGYVDVALLVVHFSNQG